MVTDHAGDTIVVSPVPVRNANGGSNALQVVLLAGGEGANDLQHGVVETLLFTLLASHWIIGVGSHTS